MSKPRKSWEPEYRFGGNPASFYRPNRLGENQNSRPVIKVRKPKKGKK